MLAVGVGNALNNPASVDRLVAVSGDQVVRDADLADLESLNDVDVALVTDFDDLAQFLRSVVLQLCSPSLTIRKLAQSADDDTYQPAPGWTMTVTPEVPDRHRVRLDPAGHHAGRLQDADHRRQRLRPVPVGADPAGGGLARHRDRRPCSGVTPRADPTTTTSGASCATRTATCASRRASSPSPARTASFVLDPIGQEIVTCTVWNSFDYDPAIGITKVNDPTAVRGDITPPATVTSSYEVTNEGNTPLSNVRVIDDKCAPGDRCRLDGSTSATSTTTTCSTSPRCGSSRAPVPPSVSRSVAAPTQTVINEATVTGTDPTGETVEATDTDDVDVYFPDIALTKLVDDPATAAPPAESVIVEPGTPVELHLRRHQHREHAARFGHARGRHPAVRGPDSRPRQHGATAPARADVELQLQRRDAVRRRRQHGGRHGDAAEPRHRGSVRRVEPAGDGDRLRLGRPDQPEHRADQVGRPDSRPDRSGRCSRTGHVHVRGDEHRDARAQPARSGHRRTGEGSGLDRGHPLHARRRRTWQWRRRQWQRPPRSGRDLDVHVSRLGHRGDPELRRDPRPAVGRHGGATAGRRPCRRPRLGPGPGPPAGHHDRQDGARRRRPRRRRRSSLPAPLPTAAPCRARTSRRPVRPSTCTRSPTRATSRSRSTRTRRSTTICDPLVFEEGDTDGDVLLDVDETWVYTCRRRSTGTSTTPDRRPVTYPEWSRTRSTSSACRSSKARSSPTSP